MPFIVKSFLGVGEFNSFSIAAFKSYILENGRHARLFRFIHMPLHPLSEKRLYRPRARALALKL